MPESFTHMDPMTKDFVIAVLLLGFSIGYTVKSWVGSRTTASGTIYVTEEHHKTLYSLELLEYPETIKFKKQVVFKVDASEADLNRE